MLNFLNQTIGRLHPLLVHLPIGILLLAALFYALARQAKYKFLEPAIGFTLKLGFFTAIFSVISGYVLSLGGDYNTDAVRKHQWAGIIAFLLTGVTILLRNRHHKLEPGSWLLLITCIFLTGHWGGSLTHGEGYLLAAFQPTEEPEFIYRPKPIANPDSAQVYADIVQPILEARCYSCHGPNKQKGKLRLDAPDFIRKGGADGKVINPGNPEQSALIARLFLPMDDRDHMPPREKPQPGKAEIELLHWWIRTGGSFTGTGKELGVDEKVKAAIRTLQQNNSPDEKVEEARMPDKPVNAADPLLLQELRNRGWSVTPLATGTNYLRISGIGVEKFEPADLKRIAQIAPQVVELQLSYLKIGDEDLKEIAGLTGLYRLYLDHTAVSDAGLESISGMSELRYLNLVGSKVTEAGGRKIKGLKNLTHFHIQPAP